MSDKIEKKIKLIHLTVEQIKTKIESLTIKLKTLEGPLNKKKRANLFQKLSKLKKQFKTPDLYLAPVEQISIKKEKDKMRRVSKKLAKKQKRLDLLRSTKNKARKLMCLICKKRGHRMKDCPNLGDHQSVGNICYNCGDNDHGLTDCPKPIGDNLPFAKCFICKETGHLSKNCPQNTNGIFYKGGGCYFCGSNMHRKAQCPEKAKAQGIRQENRTKEDFEYDFDKN